MKKLFTAFSLCAILAFQSSNILGQAYYQNYTSQKKTDKPQILKVSSAVPVQTTISQTTSSPEGYIQYRGKSHYYVLPNGKAFLDRRRVGPIYPNLFDVARKGANNDYIQTEDEDNGCNLEKMFLSTIFKRYGFDTRRYLNALEASGSSCGRLGSAEEQALCHQFHSNPACQDATPIVFETSPVAAGQSYLTAYKKGCNGGETILRDTFIPKQSKEWSKIESDLIDKKRSSYTSQLKSRAPVGQIRSQVTSSKPGATQRDIDFAVNEWIYNEAKKMTPDISDAEIKPIVESRYSPASAMRNIVQFNSEIGGVCRGKESRYNNKVYAEAMNIPAHEVLLFADYVDPANHCICK
jgi:hypothetical protein